jgi:hypothetical protein
MAKARKKYQKLQETCLADDHHRQQPPCPLRRLLGPVAILQKLNQSTTMTAFSCLHFAVSATDGLIDYFEPTGEVILKVIVDQVFPPIWGVVVFLAGAKSGEAIIKDNMNCAGIDKVVVLSRKGIVEASKT